MIKLIEQALERDRAKRTIRTLIVLFALAMFLSIFSKIADYLSINQRYPLIDYLNNIDSICNYSGSSIVTAFIER